MKTLNFNDLVEKSLNAKSSKEYACSLELKIEGKTWNAYAVSVSNRDLLFYCNQGTVTYLVDTYGSRHTAELFDWSKS
jgi:predicted GNAT family acetyltransferase